MRGNLHALGGHERLRGSIPALAGEPPGPGVSKRPPSVYPRACGGTLSSNLPTKPAGGLSPRLRGNRWPGGWGGRGARSIPALAGEPHRWRGIRRWSSVYPRACGGTAYGDTQTGLGRGLSPRLRGNPTFDDQALLQKRSIPALAGEPPLRPAPAIGAEVYPRACGGTLDFLVGQPGCAGSIPALAGEPGGLDAYPDRLAVYPRACGGTGPGPSGIGFTNGLSPRLRGNQMASRVAPAGTGSIPALAGEPSWWACPWGWRQVYPRACGGTGERLQHPANRDGLSPRLRGNQ